MGELLYRPDGIGQQRRAETLAQALHTGIGFKRLARGLQLLLRSSLLGLRRGLRLPIGRRKLEAHGLAVKMRERLRELFLLRGRPNEFYTRIDRQPNDAGLPTHQHAMARELPRGAAELELVHDRGPGAVSGGAVRRGSAGGRVIARGRSAAGRGTARGDTVEWGA